MHGRAMIGMWTGMLAISVFLPPPVRHVNDAEILTHDNRRSAGVLRDGVLTVSLAAGSGTWYPEEKDGPGHDVYAFGEDGGRLSIPGPMLRVPAGTEIRMAIRNTIAGAELLVHGLHDRPGSGTPLRVPPGEVRTVTFRVSVPGTYYYWGSTRGATELPRRFGIETQLSGALIVDPPSARVDEHIMMIGIEDDSGTVPAERKLHAAALNGLTWPHSLRSTVTVGDTIRMRWINPTDRGHPIHLHGFYFTVESKGNVSGDTLYSPEQQRLVVTEFLAPGQTMRVSWVASRPGNWLMHCHNAAHMSSHLRGGGSGSHTPTAGHGKNHTMDVMAGLVTGWQVRPAGNDSPSENADASIKRRQIRLHAQASPPRYNGLPALGFVLQSGTTAPRLDSVEVPGPALVLTAGEPVEIKVLNHLNEPTSIHWHGIELDSYFDGVSGWSGNAQSLAPPVGARDSFAVRFTPPRAGTFIYHSHFDEERQLSSGMYGPLIVLEPNSKYDPRRDRNWVLGQVDPDGPGPRATLNGSRTPILELETGPQRIRIININPNIPLTLSVLADSTPVRWRAVAKDGADLPPAHARVVPARVRLGVGETADFELTIDQPQDLRVRATDPAGGVRIDGVVRVRAPDR